MYSKSTMRIGYIGLGKMGKNMVLHLLEQGIEVVAWNRSEGPLKEVVTAGALDSKSVEDLVSKLETPRIIWLMLTAGDVTDQFIEKLIPLLEKGDLVIDGGNSFYKNTLKNAKQALEAGIHFMDIGVSGGPGGARTGACLMIGGEAEDFQKIEELVNAAASPGAFAHLGPVAAGHFAKMVHNGIEYGMMEALAEGVDILQKSQFEYDWVKLMNLYQHRSVIEGRLVGWMMEAFEDDPTLQKFSPKIGRNGEGDWTVDTGKELGVDVRVLEDAVEVRKESVNGEDSFRNRAVSAMRSKFGHHEDAIKN